MADTIVLDSSAIIAGLYGEPGSEAVLKALADDDSEVLISVVNLCEVITKLALAGASASQISGSTGPLVKHCVDFDPAQAVEAGKMALETKNLGLSLGDRACLALAISRGAAAWTTDAVWKKLTLPVAIKFIRL